MTATANTSHPDITKRNYIASYDTLSRLRILEKVVENDINSLNLKDIDVSDILGERKSKLSCFIYSELNERYPYDLVNFNKRYLTYLKVMALEDKYPLEERKKDLEEILNKIKKTEETIEYLEATEDAFDTNMSIILRRKRELEELKVQYEEQLQIINVETPKDLAVYIFNKVYSEMKRVKGMITSKIEYLERTLG